MAEKSEDVVKAAVEKFRKQIDAGELPDWLEDSRGRLYGVPFEYLRGECPAELADHLLDMYVNEQQQHQRFTDDIHAWDEFAQEARASHRKKGFLGLF